MERTHGFFKSDKSEKMFDFVSKGDSFNFSSSSLLFGLSVSMELICELQELRSHFFTKSRFE